MNGQETAIVLLDMLSDVGNEVVHPDDFLQADTILHPEGLFIHPDTFLEADTILRHQKTSFSSGHFSRRIVSGRTLFFEE